MRAPAGVRIALVATFLLALAAAGCGGDDSTESEVPTRVVHLTSFQTPSGNVGCYLSGGAARCDISERDWSAPRPAGCPTESDFGQGLTVGRSGAGEVVCAGDTTLDPSAPKLAYGSASRAGGTTCVSRARGLTCTNSGGHGFFISVQSYRLF